MDQQTLESLASLICGDNQATAPIYRTGPELTRFFGRAGVPRFRHDGSTRKWWTLSALQACTPAELTAILKRIASPREYGGNPKPVQQAVAALNTILRIEGIEVFLDGIEPQLRRVKPDFAPQPEPELKPLPPPNFLTLALEPGVGQLLAERWEEAQRCLDAGAHLAATIMMGSLLEGLLLGACQKFPRVANQAPCAPRDPATGKPKYFADWTLAEMIEVAHAVGWIGFDVKRFSHALRDFRNLIHPYQQLRTQAQPDSDTCTISWHVVQAAANDLARVLTPPPTARP